MKTKILKVKGDWEEVVSDARSTVGKPPLGKEPSEQFKRSILIAERGLISRHGWLRIGVSINSRSTSKHSEVTEQALTETNFRKTLPLTSQEKQTANT